MTYGYVGGQTFSIDHTDLLYDNSPNPAGFFRIVDPTNTNNSAPGGNPGYLRSLDTGLYASIDLRGYPNSAGGTGGNNNWVYYDTQAAIDGSGGNFTYLQCLQTPCVNCDPTGCQTYSVRLRCTANGSGFLTFNDCNGAVGVRQGGGVPAGCVSPGTSGVILNARPPPYQDPNDNDD
jgi:hypothetical protein